jgi:hypothetical protein
VSEETRDGRNEKVVDDTWMRRDEERKSAKWVEQECGMVEWKQCVLVGGVGGQRSEGEWKWEITRAHANPGTGKSLAGGLG